MKLVPRHLWCLVRVKGCKSILLKTPMVVPSKFTNFFWGSNLETLLHSIHQARGLSTTFGCVGITPKKPQYRCSRRHRLRGVRQKRGGERQVLHWALTLSWSAGDWRFAASICWGSWSERVSFRVAAEGENVERLGGPPQGCKKAARGGTDGSRS